MTPFTVHPGTLMASLHVCTASHRGSLGCSQKPVVASRGQPNVPEHVLHTACHMLQAQLQILPAWGTRAGAVEDLLRTKVPS